jgi:hypothetical protein
MTRGVLWWLLAAAALAGCTGTTYDASLETTIPDTSPTTTTTLPASTGALLAELLLAAQAMSGVISDGGDDAGLLADIEARWDAARAAMETERPELVADFDTAIRVLTTAALYDRAADADKASKNLAALVAAYHR